MTSIGGEDDPLACVWDDNPKFPDLHVMTCRGSEPRSAIAAFDMDGTIITTKSGRVFATNTNDWKLLYEPQVAQTLKRLYNDEGYKIVVITNQAGMSTGKVTKSDFRQKVEAIVAKLGVPIQLFCSTSKNSVFRKPRPGTWELLERCNNGGIAIDKSRSFYCGDAAGRVRGGPKGKKDFSSSDRLFAANLQIRFCVPEETFLGQKSTDDVCWPEFDPIKLLDERPTLLEPADTRLTAGHQEVILMVGVQGSGKSHFAEKHLAKAGYSVISNDKTGSRDKSLASLKKALGSGKSVVVDNTHVNVEARQKFLDMARRFGVPARCFWMTTSSDQARHNIIFREIVDKDHVHIGEPLINGYLNKFKPPTLDEGFTQIVRVNVVPEFKYKQHKSLYHMYLVEK